MVLKVDIESGKLYIKKSKDGPEDKYFVHNKSKWHYTCVGFHKKCSSGNNQHYELMIMFYTWSNVLDDGLKPTECYKFIWSPLF